jgi:colicin import membrane protein
VAATPPAPARRRRTPAPSAAYAGKLIGAIRPTSSSPAPVSGNPAAEVEVRAAPGGSIISRRLVKSSGHKEWDDAVLRAIDRTGSLPRDTDGRVPDQVTIAFLPRLSGACARLPRCAR